MNAASFLSNEQWASTKFKNEEERISSFLEHLNKDQENQSQLLSDFQEYYLTEKPILNPELLKRLFFGYMRKDGLVSHLKDCHKDTSGIKTRAIFVLMQKLLDNNKSHQVDEIKDIWKSLKPTEIQELKLEVIVN